VDGRAAFRAFTINVRTLKNRNRPWVVLLSGAKDTKEGGIVAVRPIINVDNHAEHTLSENGNG
jgi:hypothetical protein